MHVFISWNARNNKEVDIEGMDYRISVRTAGGVIILLVSKETGTMAGDLSEIPVQYSCLMCRIKNNWIPIMLTSVFNVEIWLVPGIVRLKLCQCNFIGCSSWTILYGLGKKYTVKCLWVSPIYMYIYIYFFKTILNALSCIVCWYSLEKFKKCICKWNTFVEKHLFKCLKFKLLKDIKITCFLLKFDTCACLYRLQ